MKAEQPTCECELGRAKFQRDLSETAEPIAECDALGLLTSGGMELVVADLHSCLSRAPSLKPRFPEKDRGDGLDERAQP